MKLVLKVPDYLYFFPYLNSNRLVLFVYLFTQQSLVFEVADRFPVLGM
jgi:hypothetical protein